MSERAHYVVGTRTFAAEVLDFARAAGLQVVGLLEPLDRDRVGSEIHGLPVQWLEDAVDARSGRVLIGTGGRGLVKLSDRRDRMTLLAFPRGRTRTLLSGGETIDASEGQRRWDLTISARRQRTYSLAAALVTLQQSLSPCAVLVNGRALKRSAWRYDGASHVLHAVFRARTARVSVRGACGGR